MFKRHQGTKCSGKCQSILIHIIVICKYSIEVNLNAVYCCACAGITVLYRKFHNAGSRIILKMSNILYPDFTCEI